MNYNWIIGIEDDDQLTIIFTEALRQAGFDTRVIHDGAEALTQVQTCQPAVIILDLHLPHVAGDKILAETADQSTRPGNG